MKILKCAIVGFAVSATVSAHACAILEFASENLLSPDQNTVDINYQEVEAFAAGQFPTRPVLSASDPRFNTGLNAPIELAGFGYAVVHYGIGTSGDPQLNLGGSLEFYFIGDIASYQFIFPQTGPGGNFSNGRITSVTLFTSRPISDAGATVILLATGLGGLTVIYRFARQ